MTLDIEWLKVKDCEVQLHEMAIAKLVACMEDLWKKDFVFKSTCRPHKAVQGSAYNLLGVVFEGQIHSSRFKYMLLSVLPDLKAHPLGKFKVGEIF